MSVESATRPPDPAVPAVPKVDIVVQTHELSKSFADEPAVSNVSLQVPQGSIFGFIGPSGSGKTTTIRLLLGVYAPTSGEALVLGRRPEEFTLNEKEQIGYMPQLFVLYPDLTVWENLNFAASLYGYPLRRHRRLTELLELVELKGHERKLVRHISGGMQRRLSLAAALVHEPHLLFLDEPTAGIDPVLRRKFWDYFTTLKEDGHTIFITTQYVGEAAHCDYVAVLAEGRLLAVDTPEGLRRRTMGGDIIHMRTVEYLSPASLDELRQESFVRAVRRLPEQQVEVVVAEASESLPKLVAWCQEHGVEIETVNEYQPSYDDVFVKFIQEEQRHVAP
jgi:ABC-2 type transport system ATP-binding protein